MNKRQAKGVAYRIAAAYIQGSPEAGAEVGASACAMGYATEPTRQLERQLVKALYKIMAALDNRGAAMIDNTARQAIAIQPGSDK